MKNMKVKTKLLVGFLIVALVSAVIGIVGAMGLRTLADNETEMYEQAGRVVDGQKLATIIQEQRVAYNAAAMKQALIDGGHEQDYSAELKELEDKRAEFDSVYTPLYDSASEDRKHILDELYSTYTKQYIPELDRLLTAMQNADPINFLDSLNDIQTPIASIETLANQFVSAGVQALSDTNDADEVTATTLSTVMIALIVFGLAFGVFLGLYNASLIATPARRLAAAAQDIALGDVEIELDINSRDELGDLARAFGAMCQSFQDQARVLNAMAEGDYSVSMAVKSEKDVVGKAIVSILESNNAMLGEIRDSSSQVSTGSTQIAEGAQALAAGSTEQAAAVQQLSASISEIYAQSEANTKQAMEAFADTQKAGEFMAYSMESMQRMTEAMQEINNASQAISQVIGVIDNIAFQTNILSLNASVEAARAGQHGKGFAVVAEEVRNLAAKSAAAAQETATLIQNSIERVNQGNVIASETSKSLDSVAEIAGRNAVAMSTISDASQRQSVAIAEVNTGIEQISTVVQTNSATSQQSAASAEEMSAQAQTLNKIVARFKLADRMPGLGIGSSYASTDSGYLPPAGESSYDYAPPSGGNKYL